MDENINATVENEGTTPQTETVEGADTPSVPENAETPAAEQPEGTTPVAEGGSDNSQPPAAPFVTVQYNHETRELTREQAIAYAQKGILYDEGPRMQKLALMAAAQGKTVDEFVNTLAEADEQRLREDKLRITSGDADAAEILVQAELAKRREALNLRAWQEQEAAETARKAMDDRLAGELMELRELCPDVAEWNDLPRSVQEDAIKNGRNLTDAYLRYLHKEGVNIEQNRAAQAAAAAASVGSQADTPPTGGDPAIEAMVRAVRNA